MSRFPGEVIPGPTDAVGKIKRYSGSEMFVQHPENGYAQLTV